MTLPVPYLVLCTKHPWFNTEMKATEEYFYVVRFIMLCKVLLTFKYVDETPVCEH